MARPKKKIDLELVRKLAAIHCTVEEIASACNCSKDTLERRKPVMEIIARGKADGKRSLRRMQWEAAQKGNVTMMIWLGKNVLDQKDVPKFDEQEARDFKLKYNLDEE